MGNHSLAILGYDERRCPTAREREEEFPLGHRSGLAKVSIDPMSCLRDRLPGDARDRLRLAVYDETIRFDIILVGDSACVAQPYLPSARGVDSPALLIPAPARSAACARCSSRCTRR